MNKSPIEVTAYELLEILEKYFRSPKRLNYAVKILGHPGVGKSALVKQAALALNRLFIDTRLAFKENVDLGGYPVPDREESRMIYFRPKFIPPREVPSGKEGIVWFLDESNRAHPTVIQTLFQIITEGTCGEHALPEKTSIVLAGNLGEEDQTTVTEFDDSALDGRLAVFHLKPSASDWLPWAREASLHPSVVRYITLFPERLWDERKVNPNPRGWHQVSEAVHFTYGLDTEESLKRYLGENRDSTLEKTIRSLVGTTAGIDFITEMTSPRELSTEEVLKGDVEKVALCRENRISQEDLMWALAGAVSALRELREREGPGLSPDIMKKLAGILKFMAASRADLALSYFYRLIKHCGIFTQLPETLALLDKEEKEELERRFASFLEN